MKSLARWFLDLCFAEIENRNGVEAKNPRNDKLWLSSFVLLMRNPRIIPLAISSDTQQRSMPTVVKVSLGRLVCYSKCAKQKVVCLKSIGSDNQYWKHVLFPTNLDRLIKKIRCEINFDLRTLIWIIQSINSLFVGCYKTLIHKVKYSLVEWIANISIKYWIKIYLDVGRGLLAAQHVKWKGQHNIFHFVSLKTGLSVSCFKFQVSVVEERRNAQISVFIKASMHGQIPRYIAYMHTCICACMYAWMGLYRLYRYPNSAWTKPIQMQMWHMSRLIIDSYLWLTQFQIG